MGEFNFYGVYVPVLLVYALIAYLIFLLLRVGINRYVEESWLIYPSLFYLCLYVVVLWLTHSTARFF
ncbi:DUF1656 domain-containing protein [Acinetobacter sp. KS-LM10]|uniref:DUF1656 domain-containing protein n=1 Tax=Acinetobacter sp. KS-LM10 TaxID=3120518 RepID=UPI0030D26DF2